MEAEVKALVSSVTVTIVFYLVLLNVQLPGNVEVPRFAKFILGLIFGVLSYTIMVGLFRSD